MERSWRAGCSTSSAPTTWSSIANTGDDIEIYGAYVSPDPDLVTFWLADRIDERGWGLKDDTFTVMDGLRELGVDVWFNLGDRDLAIAIERARAPGRRRCASPRRTPASAASLGVRARVLPMSDQPVRTRVMADGSWVSLQEFLIRRRGEGPVQDVDFRHARAAAPTPEVLESVATARAIVIGPSNPIISIGPILALPGLTDALTDSPAAVVAVSPLVNGRVLKGPTEAFMRWARRNTSSAGIAETYAGLLDGLVADERTRALPVLETSVLMDDDAARRGLAEQTLQFALGLRK